MRAALYARYSSDMQREESIEAQTKATKDFAEKHDMQIVKEYADRAITGTTDKRPAFQRLLKDAQSGLFDVVLVHKINRFGRNRIQIALNKHYLKQLDIQVIPVAEYFGEGPHTVLMESVLEGLAEFYSLELAEESMKGLMVNANKCLYNGGRVLYGYKVNPDKQYEIEPTEAPLVKEIFQKVKDGWSYKSILRNFNERGIKRRGKPWSTTSIHEMLINERYAGIYIFNQTPRKIKGKRNSRIKKSEKETVRIPGGVPAIVPDKLFREVQVILNGRRQRNRKVKYFYPLSGLVFCGLCGASYNGNHSRSGNNIYLRYRCSGRQRKGDCNNEYIQKEVLEQAAVDAIVRQVERINIEELAETFNKCVNESAISASEEAKRIRKEIAATEGKISVLLDALELGEDVKNRIKEHSQRKQELQLALLQVEKEASISRVTPEQVKKIINNLDPRQVSDEQELRAIFFRLIKRIVIHPGKKITIYTIWDNDSVSCERVPLPTPALDTWRHLFLASIEAE